MYTNSVQTRPLTFRLSPRIYILGDVETCCLSLSLIAPLPPFLDFTSFSHLSLIDSTTFLFVKRLIDSGVKIGGLPSHSNLRQTGNCLVPAKNIDLEMKVQMLAAEHDGKEKKHGTLQTDSGPRGINPEISNGMVNEIINGTVEDASKKRGTMSAGPVDLSPKKPKRRKVDLACIYCRRSHMTCDEGRPCSRCIRRNIGHLCHDEPKKANKESIATTTPSADITQSHPSAIHNIEPNPVSAHLSTAMVLTSQSQPGLHGASVFQEISDHKAPSTERLGAQQLQDNVSTTKVDTLNMALSSPFNDWTSLGHQSILSQTSEFNQNLFFSEHANSEFASLGDFLSMIEDPISTDVGVNPLNRGFSGGEPSMEPFVDRREPQISDSARDKFFLTAADPTVDVSPEERLKQVIQAKVEAGLLQPFNYARGYARLQKYMDNYMNQGSKQRILKPLSVFRPAFRAIAQSLMDIDLVLVEEAFERMLLDYDRVFTSMAIPACLWRRTGEIYRGNKEFAGLVEVSVDELRDGKLVIYELMSEDSAVNYWEKYGNIAFDSGQKAVLTSCNLRTRDRRKRRACCFSFTIQRDRYNM